MPTFAALTKLKPSSNSAATSQSRSGRRRRGRRRGDEGSSSLGIGSVLGQTPRGAPVVQAKLEVAETHDAFEREADRVAEQVTQMPVGRAASRASGARGLQPGGDSMRRGRAGGTALPLVHHFSGPTAVLSRKELSPGAAVGASAPRAGFARGLSQARSNGSPLPSSVRTVMEPRFGRDFGNVRVHHDVRASSLAGSIHAKAFTSGNDVFFKGGQFQPQTRAGQKLIAHELTHVVQQAGGPAAVQRQEETEATVPTPAEGPQAEGTEAAEPAQGVDTAEPRNPELEAVAGGEKFVRFGSRGKEVEKVQQALVDFGLRQDPPRDLLPKFGVDGIFGAETQQAVIAFQKEQGLKADGIVGPDTIRALSASTIEPLIVEDDAKGPLASGAMRKTDFVEQVSDESCAAADATLNPTGLQSKDCPGADLFAKFIADKSAGEIVRLMAKARPALVFGAASARQLIDIIVGEVRKAVAVFVKTGEVTGIPDNIGIGKAFIDAALAGGDAPVLRKGMSSAGAPPSAGVSPKLRVGGRPLEGGVRTKMEGAFGTSLGHVRLHTEPRAAAEVSRLDARAVSVGNNVAFAQGQYRPGTFVGDALLAHEIAHTLQQSSGAHAKGEQLRAASDSPALEADADSAAVGAVARMWGGTKAWLKDFAGQAMPRLKSGLKLTRCNCTKTPPLAPTVTLQLPDLKCDSAYKAVPLKEVRAVQAGAVGITVTTVNAGSMKLDPRSDFTCDVSQFKPPSIKLKHALFTEQGTHDDFQEVPVDKNLRANHKQCAKKKGQNIPVKYQVSKAVADKLKEGEIEHCRDEERAFGLSFGKTKQVLDFLNPEFCAVGQDPKNPCGLERDERLKNAPDAGGVLGLTFKGSKDYQECLSKQSATKRDVVGNHISVATTADLPPKLTVNKDCTSATYAPDATDFAKIGTKSAVDTIQESACTKS